MIELNNLKCETCLNEFKQVVVSSIDLEKLWQLRFTEVTEVTLIYKWVLGGNNLCYECFKAKNYDRYNLKK